MVHQECRCAAPLPARLALLAVPRASIWGFSFGRSFDCSVLLFCFVDAVTAHVERGSVERGSGSGAE
jgi:hypothetical protein